MSGGKSSKSETNTIAEPWSEAQPFLKNLLGDAESLYTGGAFDVAPYGGPRTAPQGALTQSALGMYGDIAAGGNPFLSGAQSAYGDLVSGNTYDDLNTVKMNVLGDVIPAVSSRFANSGMLDSSMAADTISRSAAEAIAPIEYGAWSDAQNRKLAAMGQAPSLSAARYLDPQMLSLGGQQQDAYSQQLLSDEMAKYYETANQPYDELQRAASLAMGFGGLGGSQTSEAQQPGGSTIGGIMQVAGPLAMLAKMSDRRLKADIRRIGETAEGFPKYEFRYLWDVPGIKRVGVMADEVPAHLVVDGPNGFRAVNYAGVTL